MVQDGAELGLLVIVPAGGGDCREFDLFASSQDTGEKLKKKIEKACGIPADDMELFVKNAAPDAKQAWVVEDQSLQDQHILDSAIITVGVHGMRGQTSFAAVEEDGEIPRDAVQNSIYAKGDSSYYFAHTRKSDVPEEHRIVSGGAPQKLAESQTLPEPISGHRQLRMEEDETQRPERHISNYAWGDEKEVVKIYISADSEPEIVGLAKDGKSGEVQVKWESKRLKLRVHAEKLDYVLELERLYYEIMPGDCKFRVSPNKRITLTLKKKDAHTWLKLLKPDA